MIPTTVKGRLSRADGASDDAGIGSERASPQALAEHDDGWRAGVAVLGAQRAPDESPLAEEREELRGHDRRVDDGRLAPGRQRQLVLLDSRQLAEGAGLLAQLGEVRDRTSPFP